MRAIVKNKNILEFHLDKTNPYKFDVNTGKWYGLKGTEIQNAPAGARSLIIENKDFDNVIHFIYLVNRYENESITNICKNNIRYFPILDKLNSLGYCITQSDMDFSVMTFVDAHMKEFAKYLKNNDNPSLKDFRQNNKKIIWEKKHEAYFRKNPQITQEMKEFVFRLSESDSIPADDEETVFYFLYKDSLYRFFKSMNEEYRLQYYFRKYFEMIKFLEIKSNREPFIQEFVKIEREYTAKKFEKDNKQLYENLRLQKKAFTFTEGSYETIIPESIKDFLNEARAQSNCVAGYVRRIINNETYVIFVRDIKNPETSLVTAEIDKLGNIQQFLLANNRSIYGNKDLEAFKMAWQKHIKENWIRG